MAESRYTARRRAQAERQVARAEEWASLHKVRTRYDGSYRAVCSCGWSSERSSERGAAVEAGEAHHGALAIPDYSPA